MNAWRIHPRGSFGSEAASFFNAATPLESEATSPFAAGLTTFLRLRFGPLPLPLPAGCLASGCWARPNAGDNMDAAAPVPAVIRNSRRLLLDMDVLSSCRSRRGLGHECAHDEQWVRTPSVRAGDGPGAAFRTLCSARAH